jgi:hypothetical protein
MLADGIIPYLAQDAVFTLHQLASLNQADPNGILTGRLDVQRAGIFGVSLGGIVTPTPVSWSRASAPGR